MKVSVFVNEADEIMYVDIEPTDGKVFEHKGNKFRNITLTGTKTGVIVIVFNGKRIVINEVDKEVR